MSEQAQPSGSVLSDSRLPPRPGVLLSPAPAVLRSLVGISSYPPDCVFESCRKVFMESGELWTQEDEGVSGLLCRWEKVALSEAKGEVCAQMWG